MRRISHAVGVVLGIGGAALVVAWGMCTPSPAGAASLPGLSLDRTVVTPGSTVTVEGTHWPKDRQLQAVVCGGGIVSVSSDCDLAHAVTFGPADNGVVQTSLVVTTPPVPCPCVVMVTQLYPSEVERLPMTILGASSAPVELPSAVRPILRVFHVRVVSTSTWTSWFGAAASRQLIVSIHNAGSTAIRPLLVAHWVQGGDHFVITARAAASSAQDRALRSRHHLICPPSPMGCFPLSGRSLEQASKSRWRVRRALLHGPSLCSECS